MQEHRTAGPERGSHLLTSRALPSFLVRTAPDPGYVPSHQYGDETALEGNLDETVRAALKSTKASEAWDVD